MKKTFFIAGGDLRFATLADSLADFYTVYAAGFDRNVSVSEKVCVIDRITDMNVRADYIVLPLPISTDGVTVNTPYSGRSLSIESLVPVIKENGIVFGGMISPEIKKIFEDRGIAVADYAKREEFAVLNAVATAENRYRMHGTASTVRSHRMIC